MKLSIYACHALESGFASHAEALHYLPSKGITGAVFLEHELRRIPFDRYCDLIEDAGLRKDGFVSLANVASFSAQERQNAMSLLKAQIDGMEKRGIPRLMIAPDVRPAKSEDQLLEMREHMVEAYSAAIEYAKGSGIAITIENYSLVTRADSKLKDLRYLFDCVPELGFVLDTGNFFCVEEDLQRAYDVLSDRIVMMHCKDWTWDPYGHMVRQNLPRFNGCAVGDGILPIADLMDRVARDHPDLCVMIEDNSDHVCKEHIDRSAEFLLKGWNFDV